MSEGFLGRWSKRKLDVKQGKALEPEPLATPVSLPQVSPEAIDEVPAAEALTLQKPQESAPPVESVQRHEAVAAPPEPLPLTLEDVKILTAESDFSPFAARNVAPEVKNAAMKKLFADPRYNVMDGMDIYTGDYSKPDPIPESMLRQLVSAKFLGLFDREEKEEAEAAAAAAAALESGEPCAEQARDVADNPTDQTVAQCEPIPSAVPEPLHHADADLRLQQDDAPPGETPGRGPE
jgi:hypothetical protein